MAFTDPGKGIVMDEGIDGSDRYLSLHLSNGTELNGHGYARKMVTSAQIDVASATGVSTLISSILPLLIYTANDASAQVAAQVALYSASTGGVQIYQPQNLTNPPALAPVSGQSFELTTVTLNP